MNNYFYKKESLLRSLLEKNGINSINEALELLKIKAKKSELNLEKISFSELKGWYLNKESGDIRHRSGKFFQIEGLEIEIIENDREMSWSQPIINQPEIGFLGCITKEIDGILYFLIQAKVEPGNINTAQYSPTLQATKSNFTQQHKGSKPPYLSKFINLGDSLILSDQLQSEHGTRFFRKRNRNLIILNKDIDYDPESFIWLTLAQIKELCKFDNTINMDLKSVIGSLNLSFDQDLLRKICKEYSLKENSFGYKMLNSLSKTIFEIEKKIYIESWLSNYKFNNNIQLKKIPIDKLKDWKFGNKEISHYSGKFFSVNWISVNINGREVLDWDQPIFEVRDIGIICFFTRFINGSYYFLVQAKKEFGLIDSFELGPTIMATPSNYNNPEEEIPFYKYFCSIPKNQYKFNAISSEEGGRFLRDQNEHIIIECNESFNEVIPNDFLWISYIQLMELMLNTNTVNVQARTLLSSINYCD